jgi:hypothetical protein
LGIFENQQALQIEQYLARSPQELWPHVIGAAILGSDAGASTRTCFRIVRCSPALQPSSRTRVGRRSKG